MGDWKAEDVYRLLMDNDVMKNPEHPVLSTLDIRLQEVIRGTIEIRERRKTVRHELRRPGMLDKSDTCSDRTAPAISEGTLPASLPLSKGQNRNIKKRRQRERRQVEQKGKTAAKFQSSAKDEVMGPIPPPINLSGHCRRCFRQPESHRCIRTMLLDERSAKEMQEVRGCVITCAPEGDRLQPKQVTPRKLKLSGKATVSNYPLPVIMN